MGFDFKHPNSGPESHFLSRIRFMKEMMPLTFSVTMGGNIAGVVETLDDGITELKIGDEVYGSAIILFGGSGGFAEYAIANATDRPIDNNGSVSLAGLNLFTGIGLPHFSSLDAGQQNL